MDSQKDRLTDRQTDYLWTISIPVSWLPVGPVNTTSSPPRNPLQILDSCIGQRDKKSFNTEDNRNTEGEVRLMVTYSDEKRHLFFYVWSIKKLEQTKWREVDDSWIVTSHIHTLAQINRADRQIDGQTGRQIVKFAERQTDRWIESFYLRHWWCLTAPVRYIFPLDRWENKTAVVGESLNPIMGEHIS